MKHITQSMIKNFQDYESGLLCGDVFLSRYKGENFQDAEGAAALGVYFEFLLSGNLPKSGNVPQPEYLKSALKKNPDIRGLKVSDMTAPYRLVHDNVIKTQKHISNLGWTIVGAGKKYTNDGHGIKSDIDIVVSDGKSEFMVDVKYSGLINDRWDKWGWVLERENQLKFHSIQAMHYHLTTSMDFYYLVVSSVNNEDVKLIKWNFTDEALDSHLEEIERVRSKINLMENIGWENHPHHKRCSSCILRQSCEQRAIAPTIEQIYL